MSVQLKCWIFFSSNAFCDIQNVPKRRLPPGPV